MSGYEPVFRVLRNGKCSFFLFSFKYSVHIKASLKIFYINIHTRLLYCT